MAEAPLPIMEIIPELKAQLKEQHVLILQAPPGAGKSTVLPLQLLEEPWLQGQKILMLEPRRLAARSVAQRMAQLLGEGVGETVGYRIRFENRTGKNTRIEVLTEGILTRMLQQDNALEGVGLVIFDEFHERSLQADLALALSREVQGVLREDLRLLIMSATLDGGQLSQLLGGAPVLTSEGRQYPVELRYLPQDRNEPLHQQVARVVRKALREEEADILVFLPGTAEIKRTAELLESEDAAIHPLYGDLPPQQQQEALLPHPQGRRKVVLATSIAETSLTIEGIKVVIDSGYSRVPRFDPRSGLTRLETVPVTADTADQRTGRAGRLGPGIGYRLWSEGSHLGLQPNRQPEILEADLAPTVLELANWGVKDMQSLSWLTPPPAGALGYAGELLHRLGALEEGSISEKGKALLGLPTHPRLAQLLLAGRRTGLAALAADVAALLEERDPLQREAGADLSLRLEALRRWRAKGHVQADRFVLQRVERLAMHWRRLLRAEADNTMPADTDIGQLLAAAYPERIAKREGASGRYRLANGRIAQLPEHDPLMHEDWLTIAQLDAGRKGGSGRIFMAAPLNPDDVLEMATQQDVLAWDAQKGELLARSEIRLGDIVVESSPLPRVAEEERQRVLCEAVRTEGLQLLNWSEEARQWQARVLSLRHWRPGEAWSDVRDEALLASLESWLAPYLQGVRKRDDFARLDLPAMLQSLISWELQQALDRLAPLKMQVPSGSQIKLQYKPDGSAPVLAVRLQEMFGQLDTPTVNEGRTPVLVHLLSPAYRPAQVTQDLRSFWQNTYAEVRKDLRGRYPKHSWPEDPFTAEAVRGVKRRK